MEKIKIEYIPINEIIPYSKNPRKNEKTVDIVAKSIKEFGFKNPIILDKNNEIVAGHTRLKAAIKLGLTEVPIIWADDLTESQVKAYRIMDNKSMEYAEWDFELLKTELIELRDLNFDLDLTGLHEVELDKLIPDNLEEPELPDVTKPKYNVKLGDIYQLGNHRLMCGDATNEQSVTQLMNNQRVILMVTDPPYGINYDANRRNETGVFEGNRSIGKVYNDNRADWTEAYILFKGDIAYIYHAGVKSGEVQSSIERAGFHIVSQIIWVKPHFAFSRNDYHGAHEPIYYAVRKGKNHNWQGSRKETTIWEIAGMNPMGGSKDPADEKSGHSTQKPIECMKRPIKNNSKEGDIVYDPFGGSGSTLIACEQTNRICYMMEIDPLYCSVIIERWEKFTGKTTVKL